MPEKIAAQRVRAPAAAFSAVWPTEPPTGWPRNRAAAMLAMPCALKSASMSGGAPSGLGAASETPAPWTSTITATTSAPVSTSAENSMCSGGRDGSGMPVGIAPTSATVATAGQRQGEQARQDEGDDGGVGRDARPGQHDEQDQRRAADEHRCRLDAPGMEDDVDGSRERDAAASLGAREVADLTEHDVGGDAREEAEHDRERDEARVATEAEDARRPPSVRRRAG